MSSPFPPMPPLEELNTENEGIAFRACTAEDAQAIFDLVANPGLQFMLEQDRPRSFEQLRDALALIDEKNASGVPAAGLYWAVEFEDKFVGLFTVRFDMLDKTGGRIGLLLRSATFQTHLSPEFVSTGIVRHIRAIDDGAERVLVKQFGVEQMVGWTDDANENARAMVVNYGMEGPLNHDHPGRLGFYRRPTRSNSTIDRYPPHSTWAWIALPPSSIQPFVRAYSSIARNFSSHPALTRPAAIRRTASMVMNACSPASRPAAASTRAPKTRPQSVPPITAT